MDDTTFGGRLREAIRASGRTQKALARDVGVEEAAVSLWVNDKSLPDGAHLIQIVRLLGCNAHWLLVGDGTRDGVPSNVDRQLAEIRGELSEIREMLPMPANMFRLLREEDNGQAEGASG